MPNRHISLLRQCMTIKFILGGRFKESKLFSEQQKRIGVFYLKSCRPSIFSLYVRGKVTKTIELQGKSPKYQQEYAENDFQIKKKSLFTHFRCYCKDDTLMKKFY